MSTKICSRCFKPKDIDEYQNRYKTCTICREYNRNYLKKYNQNKPLIKQNDMKEYQKYYYKKNRDELKQKSKENWEKKKQLLIKANNELVVDT